MKKVILIYGLIAGGITSTFMLITMPMYVSGTLSMENGALIGYAGMVIALALIFFGIKSYRDNQAGGKISFWQGFLVGIAISLIAAFMYAGTWELCYTTITPEFSQKMMEQYFVKMKDKGASAAEMQKAQANLEMYKNPVIRFGVSMTEIFPVGLVITLVSAGLLRRKEFLPPN